MSILVCIAFVTGFAMLLCTAFVVSALNLLRTHGLVMFRISFCYVTRDFCYVTHYLCYATHGLCYVILDPCYVTHYLYVMGWRVVKMTVTQAAESVKWRPQQA